MEYTVSEQQLISLLDSFFRTIYPGVKYKKEGEHIFVYNGKKMYKTFRKVRGGYVRRNVIMHYSPFRGVLEIDPEVYEDLIKWIPLFVRKKMVLDFFTKWFQNKFNVDIERTYFADKEIMDNMED